MHLKEAVPLPKANGQDEAGRRGTRCCNRTSGHAMLHLCLRHGANSGLRSPAARTFASALDSASLSLHRLVQTKSDGSEITVRVFGIQISYPLPHSLSADAQWHAYSLSDLIYAAAHTLYVFRYTFADVFDTHLQMCLYSHLYLYACLYVHMAVCTHICIYIYAYIYVHTYTYVYMNLHTRRCTYWH